MKNRATPLSCVRTPAVPPWRPGGAETAVVIVIVVAAAVLARSGCPVRTVLELLAGSAVVAVGAVSLLAGQPLRALRPLLWTMLTSAQG